MTARGIAPWVLTTLVIAAAVHVATLYAIPRIVMERTAAQVGASNTMHYGKRPDASSRGVVRPSTDLLYSICPYDLSNGRRLLVTAPVPQGTYWSMSAYDADTNNYFVRDDRQVHGWLHLFIDPPTTRKELKDPNVIVSPTHRGSVIIRTLIDSEAHLATLDTARRKAECAIEQ